MVSIAACLVGGCTINADADTDTNLNNAESTPEVKIKVDRVHINWGEDISFSGYSVLPDGTYLQTQLYADDKPEAWWPADKYIQVRSGEWQIIVPLSENATTLYVGSETYFLLKVWEKDNPSVMATFPFDLIGPPPAPELERENTSG